MRVLITGTTGQIGSATAQRLRAVASVMATDRTQLDLAKLEAIPHVLDDAAADLVINTAAYTAVDQAESEPNLAHRINAEAPGVIARWCAERNVPLIHFSTDYVFDGSGVRPWCEEDQPTPLGVYGLSKLVGEQEVRAASGTSLTIRTSWVYAAQGTNFLRKIVAAAQNSLELRVVADQIGAPTSAALIAEAVATFLTEGLTELRSKARRAGGTVHFAATGETSWYNFATAIVAGLRERGVALAVKRIAPIRSEDLTQLARRPLNSRLNLDRLQSVFGLVPPDWREVLAPELDRVAQNVRSTLP